MGHVKANKPIPLNISHLSILALHAYETTNWEVSPLLLSCSSGPALSYPVLPDHSPDRQHIPLVLPTAVTPVILLRLPLD
jgi:hypothetical protein